MNMNARRIARCVLLAPVLGPVLDASDWTHLAGDAARSSQCDGPAVSLSFAVWTAAAPADAEFVASAAPLAANSRVFAHLRQFENNVHVANLIAAYRAADGEPLWSTPIEADSFESWATPAYDLHNHTVLIATGLTLTALAAEDGAIVWQTPLFRDAVNAAPAVTADLVNAGVPANRVFITDFGFSATLYAVNVDPYDPVGNPYQPGETAWTAPLGPASGNSPTYADGCVVVATRGGGIRAFDAASGAPRWNTPLGVEGFYGGVTIADGFVYAATYDFYDAQNNSHLYKLRLDTGALVWEVACERTNSIPVVAGAVIYLAGGIPDFDSAVKVQAFDDLGTSATLRWDTVAATGGALSVGGWTFQPLHCENLLYVGRLPPGAQYGPYCPLRILDLNHAPGDPGFIVGECARAGGSPAAADGRLFSIGPAGLVAFLGVLPGDTNCDGVINFFDIDPFILALFDPAAYEAAFPDCDLTGGDLNGDGLVNFFDIDGFLVILFD